MSRRARTRAGARPWETLPASDGVHVDDLLAQARRFPPQEATQPDRREDPAGPQDRRRERER